MKIYVDRKPDNCNSCILNDKCDRNNCFLEEFHKNTLQFYKSITKGVKSSILSDPNNDPLKLLDNKRKVLEKLKDKMKIVKKDIELYERRTGHTTSVYSQMIYAWILIYVYENYIKKCNNEEEIDFVIERLSIESFSVIEEILTIFCNKYDLKRNELYRTDDVNSSLFSVDLNYFTFDKIRYSETQARRFIRYDGKNFNFITENPFLYYTTIHDSRLERMYLFDDNFKDIILSYWCSKLENTVLFSIPEEYEDKFEMITHLYEKSLEKK